MSAPTPETLAELRRLLDDMRALALREGVYNGNRAVLAIIERVEPLLDAAAERDALRTWQERVALAAGLADEVAGYGVHLEADPDTAAEHVAGLLDIADTHVECPIYCGDCGEPLADTPCDHCGGSGCGPGTGSGAYEECGWCAGAGKVHVGCAHLSYAELCAERDALAAKLAEVRALHIAHDCTSHAGMATICAHRPGICLACREPLPCPTIRALDESETDHE